MVYSTMASFSVSCPKSSAFVVCGLQPQNPQQSKVSFLPASTSSLPSSSSSVPLRLQGTRRSRSAVSKVAISNSAPVPKTELEVPSSGAKDELEKPSSEDTVPDASSISAFMAQVSDLVKLVDSRDIMELQLKQQGCELIIRKKEALPQPPPVVMMQPASPQAMPYQLPAAPSSVPTSPAPVAPASAAPALPAPAKMSKSSHPPMKCPMAGTFYRSPAPGEPPFVKVGDKVKKGQILCIVEAMKLMNEIEADQSGTIVEVVAEDGKPVSVDTPLFIIAP